MNKYQIEFIKDLRLREYVSTQTGIAYITQRLIIPYMNSMWHYDWNDLRNTKHDDPNKYKLLLGSLKSHIRKEEQLLIHCFIKGEIEYEHVQVFFTNHYERAIILHDGDTIMYGNWLPIELIATMESMELLHTTI